MRSKTAYAISVALVVILAALMIFMFIQASLPESGPGDSTNEGIGQILFGDEADPGFSPIMLMIAVMLLVALLGAVFLAKDEGGDQ
jgi:NADH:ubiquinone oxidoreductase subunit 6 (subunit J)